MVQLDVLPGKSLDAASGTTVLLASFTGTKLGQCVVDLLIQNIEDCTRIGCLTSNAVVQVAGKNAYGATDGRLAGLSTSLEVYQSTSTKLIIIQQRAPLHGGKRTDFARGLLDWMKSLNLTNLVVLGGLDSTNMLDSEISMLQETFYLIGAEGEASEKLFESAGFKKFDVTSHEQNLMFARGKREPFNDDILPDSGIVSRLFRLVTTEPKTAESISISALLRYVTEGSGHVVAQHFAGPLLEMFNNGKVPDAIVTPESWATAGLVPVHDVIY
eukprot:Clim_evm33s136 gene=Clim_evmTU33s136